MIARCAHSSRAADGNHYRQQHHHKELDLYDDCRASRESNAFSLYSSMFFDKRL